MSEFYGFVKGNVQERIIQCWMDDENISREHAISCYADNDFYKLCDRLKYICKFSFDGESQTDCFESVDNNFVIPVEIIDEVPSDYAELKKERDELKGAVKKHFEANCTIDNYPNYNDADVELWKAFGMGDCE